MAGDIFPSNATVDMRNREKISQELSSNIGNPSGKMGKGELSTAHTFKLHSFPSTIGKLAIVFKAYIVLRIAVQSYQRFPHTQSK